MKTKGDEIEKSQDAETEIRWQRNDFSEKVRVELKAKSWKGGSFAGTSWKTFQAGANASAMSLGPNSERKTKNLKQKEQEGATILLDV